MSTHNIHSCHYKKETHKIIAKLQLWDLFQGTPERVRNNDGKRAIGVRATEGLHYLVVVCTICYSFVS